MKKEVLYTYLGTNGIITTPIHIEDTYYIRKIRISADAGKVLTKDFGTSYVYSAIIPEEEVDLWVEFDDPGQK